ncbi:SAM-dependent methyltransferase [Bacillus manliponensis]|uniref:SAM-dependent methyltransferase n=1 Tax=Bacillus manliponensis TaxID=574376 RepID=A0A073K222_9BACI|nr:class I SAM-dependent methyltransferase [Bacillus manliponensis]KEK20472.1 SAM-dependent methyltransferase [Bacillus manliponensis]
MAINFHDHNNKYTYSHRQADSTWRSAIKTIVNVKGKKILDVGCGGGIYTKELTHMGASEVIGFDFSKEILEAARENCAHLQNVSFVQGDAHNINFPNETFDIVISRAVVHHLKNVSLFLQEAYRILKHDGVLILQDRTIEDCTLPGNPDHIRGYFFSCYPKLIPTEKERRPTTQQLQHELENTGFQTSSIHTLWETRKIHSSTKALLQDLSPRTGRSILHELSDEELSHLLHHIHVELGDKEHIVERDRWTIWVGYKAKL